MAAKKPAQTNDEKKTITAMGQAQRSFTTATTSVQKVLAQIPAFEESLLSLSTQIEDKQSQLNGLNEELAEGVRRNKAELDLRVFEDEAQVLKELMAKHGFHAISSSDYQIMETKLENATRENEEQVQAAVTSAEKSLHVKYGSEKSSIESKHKEDTAEFKADIRALTSEKDMLSVQLERAQQDLKDEREARIKIAEAETQKQGVVVNTNGK